MEMEALVFAALTHMAGVRSAVVCVTLLDRSVGDCWHCAGRSVRLVPCGGLHLILVIIYHLVSKMFITW